MRNPKGVIPLYRKTLLFLLVHFTIRIYRQHTESTYNNDDNNFTVVVKEEGENRKDIQASP